MSSSQLKDITIKIGSGATPRGGKEAYKKTGISLIRSMNVLDFSFNKDGLAFIDVNQAKKLDNVKVKEGDILFNITGDSIARTCMVPPEILPARVNQHVSIIRCKDDIDPQFVNYYLINLKPYLMQICGVGGTRNALTKEALEKLPINVPIEQKKIAKVLSDLDTKIELNNKINAELEAMAKLIYDYWFVQFDFPDKNGKPYKSSGGKMVWNAELKREIPEGWKNGIFNDIASVVGGSTPSRKTAEYFSLNGTPWITPKDLAMNSSNKFITRGEVSVTDKGLKAASLSVMPKDTILLSSRAPIGYMAISRECVTTNQGFKSFVPDKGYPTAFVFYTIKNAIPTILNNASGSTFKEVSGTTLKGIQAILPQQDILKSWTKVANPIFEKQNIIELENQKLAELRDWLLPMLMNGQVTVKDAEDMGYAMAAEEEVGYSKKRKS